MRFSFQCVAVLGLLNWVAACGSDPNSGAPCPEVNGEFGPSHCAYVEGRIVRAGVPVPGAGIRVEQSVPVVTDAYASDLVGTDAAGRFGLVVFRLNPSQPPTVPDTVRVQVKLYASEAAAGPGMPADDSLLVLMTFAPMGTPVDTTEAELALP